MEFKHIMVALFCFFILANFIVGMALIVNGLWMQGIGNVLLGIFLIVYVKFRYYNNTKKGSGTDGEQHTE